MKPPTPDKPLSVRNRVTARAYLMWSHLTHKSRSFPSALLVGPRRTGTTSLYQTLNLHPNIMGAVGKEVKFFDCNYRRGLNWYQGFFPRKETLTESKAITIEASPYYFFHPLAARRIYEHFPQMKIIITLRNPVNRAYSHYRMNYDLGVETLPTFEAAIEAEETRLAGEEEKIIADDRYPLFNHMHLSYQAQGLYVDQLERWFGVFPREQIMVINSEEFFTEMPKVFDEMIDFLDLPAWELTTTRNANPRKYQPMNPETRERLTDYYRPYNHRLYNLLAESFGWDE